MKTSEYNYMQEIKRLNVELAYVKKILEDTLNITRLVYNRATMAEQVEKVEAERDRLILERDETTRQIGELDAAVVSLTGELETSRTLKAALQEAQKALWPFFSPDPDCNISTHQRNAYTVHEHIGRLLEE